MNKKSIGKNILMNVIRVLSGVLLPMISYPYIARTLGPDKLGKVDFITAFVNYFVLISTLGIPSYGIVVCAKNKNDSAQLKKTICELLYITLILQIITYSVFLLLIFQLKKFQEDRLLLVIQSLSIFFTAFSIEWLYNALEEFSYITIRTMIIKFVSLLAIFMLVHEESDYVIYAGILVLSTAAGTLCNLLNAKKHIKLYPLRNVDLRSHLKPILAFSAAAIAATINSNIDITMLGLFTNDKLVGLYSLSVKTKTLITAIITAALAVFLPRFSFLIKQNKTEEYKQLWRKSFQYTVLSSSLLSSFCFVFAEEILLFFGGHEFTGALIPMRIFAVCIYVLGWTWSLGVGVLQPLGLERNYAFVLLGACVVNVSLNAILIPNYQVAGAAFATLLTEIFNAFMFYYTARKYVKAEVKSVKVLLYAVGGMITTFTARKLILGLIENIILRLAVGGGISFALYSVIFVFDKELRLDLYKVKERILRRSEHRR